MPARRNRPRTVQLLLLVIVVATAAIAFELYRRAGKRADGRIPVAATDVQPVPPGAPPVDPASVLQLPRVLPQTVKEYQEELRAIKRHLLASIPDRPEVYVQVAMIYLDLGQDQKALETWRHVRKLVANVALAHLGIGTILADRGENENAIGPLRKAVELQPGLAIASQLL